jgi:hypothetical protein
MCRSLSRNLSQRAAPEEGKSFSGELLRRLQCLPGLDTTRQPGKRILVPKVVRVGVEIHLDTTRQPGKRMLDSIADAG